MITCITQDTDCQTYADEKIRQSHITVGVDIKYQCSLHDTDNMDYSAIKGRVRNEGAVLLPYLFDLNEKYNDCVKLINIIISKNTETVRKSSYNVLADWFRLAGKLTDMVTSEIEAQYTSMPPYSYRYIDLAREYISENYARRLSVDEVAAHTGISSGYLQLIFRQHANMGVTEYINYHKVQLAKQYIRGRRLSLKDISVQLGIDDPSYMSRLFKKIEGISYREYCQKYLGT
jgi:YesN/AraC family two-component response regulator